MLLAAPSKEMLRSCRSVHNSTIAAQEELDVFLALARGHLSTLVLCHCLLDAPLGQSTKQAEHGLRRCFLKAAFPRHRAILFVRKMLHRLGLSAITMARDIGIAITMARGFKLEEGSARGCQFNHPQVA